MKSNENNNQKRFSPGFLIIVFTFVVTGLLLTAHRTLPTASASDPGGGDWPMWGGTPDRNMVSKMKGLPITWDIKTKKHLTWVTQLPSPSYGHVLAPGGLL